MPFHIPLIVELFQFWSLTPVLSEVLSIEIWSLEDPPLTCEKLYYVYRGDSFISPDAILTGILSNHAGGSALVTPTGEQAISALHLRLGLKACHLSLHPLFSECARLRHWSSFGQFLSSHVSAWPLQQTLQSHILLQNNLTSPQGLSPSNIRWIRCVSFLCQEKP